MGDQESDDVIADYPFTSGDSGGDESFTCEVCGENFETERGKNIHAGQAHPEE